MRLRPLSAGDRAALARLLAATDAFNEADRGVALELIDDVSSRGEASDYTIVCAEDGEGALAGYACFGKVPLTESSFDLYWIVVSEAARGRGVGRALLEAACEGCRRAGGRRLFAETSSLPAYLPARRFYEAQGFRLVSRIEDFYAPGNDRLIYSKNLG